MGNQPLIHSLIPLKDSWKNTLRLNGLNLADSFYGKPVPRET